MFMENGNDLQKITLEQLENGTVSDRIIELKSVFKEGKITLEPAFDPKLGWYAGVERLSEEQKKERAYYVKVNEPNPRENTRVQIFNGKTFDLGLEIDRINWQWVKHSPVIAESFEAAQSSTRALYYVHIEARESQAVISTHRYKFEAQQLVFNDAPTNLADRALLLGMDFYGQPTSVALEFLLAEAEKNPTRIHNVYKDRSMRVSLLVAKAKRVNKIVFVEREGVYKLGHNILGSSDEAMISHLSHPENKDLLLLLEQEVEPAYYDRKNTATGATATTVVLSTNSTNESEVQPEAQPAPKAIPVGVNPATKLKS
jgi:hypothetical protein